MFPVVTASSVERASQGTIDGERLVVMDTPCRVVHRAVDDARRGRGSALCSLLPSPNPRRHVPPQPL